MGGGEVVMVKRKIWAAIRSRKGPIAQQILQLATQNAELLQFLPEIITRSFANRPGFHALLNSGLSGCQRNSILLQIYETFHFRGFAAHQLFHYAHAMT
jgi:hypothetical protein